MIGTNFKDVTDNPAKRLSDSPLGKLLENFSETPTGKYDSSLAKETENGTDANRESTNDKNDRENDSGENSSEPIKNKQDGLAREHEVEDELRKQYPEKDGYEIISEAYLRDKDGNIVNDPETGEARRIDFVVVKDGKIVDSVEVTSKTADKTAQSAKEVRIREAGGNYIKDSSGNLIEIPSNVQTRIERRD